MKLADEVSEIADFIIKYGKGLYEEYERSLIESYIDEHIGFGTLLVIRDKQKRIVSAVRWNWATRDTAKILDLVIRPDYRNKALLRDMLIRCKLAMPQLKYISFHRKRANRLSNSTYLIEDFIGGFHGKR